MLVFFFAGHAFVDADDLVGAISCCTLHDDVVIELCAENYLVFEKKDLLTHLGSECNCGDL